MKLWGVVVFSLFTSCVMADGIRTAIMIPNWTIQSSESLYYGTRLKSQYQLWNLLDGDSRTTWVYNSLDYRKQKGFGINTAPEYRIEFSARKPTAVDELRIQIGYQKSMDLFLANSRPSKVEIWGRSRGIGRKLLRTIEVKDEMGWKSIKIPKQTYEAISVSIVGIKRGTVDDLCVSEMMLRCDGENLTKMPPCVFYTKGGDTPGVSLYSPERKVIAHNWLEFSLPEFSPNGRLVAGGAERKLWVIDLYSAKIIKSLPDVSTVFIKWLDNRRVAFQQEFFGKGSQKHKSITVKL